MAKQEPATPMVNATMMAACKKRRKLPDAQFQPEEKRRNKD
jgi:hypothetical protein